MAERQDSSKSGDDNDIDFENEFEFNPSEWMVVDDDDGEEEENENAADDSSMLGKNIEEESLSDWFKQTGEKLPEESSTSASGCNTRTNSSFGLTSEKEVAIEILHGKVNNSLAQQTRKSPVPKERKSIIDKSICKPSDSNCDVSSMTSHQKKFTHGSEKGRTLRIAEMFDKTSVQNKPTKSEIIIKEQSTSPLNTKAAPKRKAEDNLRSSSSTKVKKHTPKEQSEESPQFIKGSIGKSADVTSVSMLKDSSQRTNHQITPNLGSKQEKVEAHTGSTKLNDKKRTFDDEAAIDQGVPSGGSIAEVMGVKVSEKMRTEVVDNDDVLSSNAEKRPGSKKSSDEGIAPHHHNKAGSKATSGTISPPSTLSQGSVKEGMSFPTSGNTSTTSPGPPKKRIVRRFHRTTQTSVPQVASKLLQCLIRIPSLDWPKQPSCCDIGLMTDNVTSSRDSLPSSCAQIVPLKPDTVAEDVFEAALKFGVKEDCSLLQKNKKGNKKYGIRICQIFSSDLDKLNSNIKKADGYVLSFASKNAGVLDLFFEEEEGVVQMYNYFRKNRLGPRHICASIFKPPTVRDKKDKTAKSLPGVTATITFDQNYANSAYIAHSKAQSWNKPKADVYLSVHNVPKDVPISFFSLIFPDAVSVEMDDPSLKVTQDTGNRIKLGMPRRLVDRFLNLFSQVVINENPLVFTSGLTQEEDVPEMKGITLKRKKMVDQAEIDDQSYSVLSSISRDINAETKSKKKMSAQPESEVIMHVENVDFIERVLTCRPGAWRGPATTDSLQQLVTSPPRAKKSRARASTTSKVFRVELSDISDESDFGEEWPQKKVVEASVVNKRRQTQPMERQSRDTSKRCHSSGPDERFVDLSRQGEPYRQKPFTNLDDSNRDRFLSSRQVGLHKEERLRSDSHKKWPDLNDADFHKNHKVIVASHQMSLKSVDSYESTSQDSYGEKDLRCMLESLKSQKSSMTRDRLDAKPSVSRSEEFGRRSQSPRQRNKPCRRKGNHSRSPGRQDWDRRIVSRKSPSPYARGSCGKSPSPNRPRHERVELERPNFRRSSLSPSGKRDWLRSPPSPGKRRKKSSSPPLKPWQHEHRKSREWPIKRSLSPILPFRPGQASNKGRKESQKQQQSDSIGLRQSPPSKAKPVFNDKNRELQLAKGNSSGRPIGGHSDIAISKTLYNTLMERLREKAADYQESKDKNLISAASVYSQINHLAETLTAIKNDEVAVKSFGSGVDYVESFIQETVHLDRNSNAAGSDSSKDLHPDLLRYVNAKPGSGNANKGTRAVPADTPTPSMAPPPIPPPVAPPLFTSTSPTDKKAQLEAIAKQLVSDLKRQGPLAFNSNTNTNTNTNQGGSGSVAVGSGSSVGLSNSQGDAGNASLSGGMWMVPPSIAPPPMPGGLFSVPPPPIPPNVMPRAQMPPITPMGMMNMTAPGNLTGVPSYLPRGAGGTSNSSNNDNSSVCRQS